MQLVSSQVHAPSPIVAWNAVADAAHEAEHEANQRASESIAGMLKLLDETLAPQRRAVRAGDSIYRGGERFGQLCILNSGNAKIVSVSPDGREQVVSLKFRGDWMGFDGIASGRYTCDAVAMDTGEVWMFRYDALLAASANNRRC